MDACVRGFSFMPSEVIVKDLQFIEGTELERTWKTSRRQRIKEQEQKIWEDFVKEKDVVTTCKDDPYQFLHELPESCLKEMLEVELKKMKKEKKETPPHTDVEDTSDPHVTHEAEHSKPTQEQPRQDDGDCIPIEQAKPSVTIVEPDHVDSEMFQIYDDETNLSGVEEDAGAASRASSACTVREKESDDVISTKSTENFANEIESNIYWAKIKDLRLKIIDEIANAISLMDCLEVFSLERDKLIRVRRRANQFAITYQRNRLYPLHRQMSDITRIVNRFGPFGRHTQFQALMVRVVSFHQNLLTAFQIASRSFEQTFWLAETSTCVRALVAAARETKFDHRAFNTDYHDQMMESCDKMDAALTDYTQRVVLFFDAVSLNPSKADLNNKKKLANKKSSDTVEPKLSMYSMDTSKTKSVKDSKDNHSVASKVKVPVIDTQVTKKGKKDTISPKGKKGRWPLMRAPGGRRRAPAPRDQDLTTMVQQVTTCASQVSEISSPTMLTDFSPKTPPTNRSGSGCRPRKKMTKAESQEETKKHHYSPRSRRIYNLNAKMDSVLTPKKLVQVNEIEAPSQIECSINAKEAYNQLVNEASREAQAILTDGKPTDTTKTDDSQPNNVINISVSVKDTAINTTKNSEENVKQSNSKKIVKDDKEEKAKTEKEGKIEREKHKENNEEKRTPPIPSNREKSSNQGYDVTRLLKQLCSGDASGTKSERISGSRNAQLHCVSGSSPRTPSTPQLLRILEETIQKKIPRPMYPKSVTKEQVDRYRLTFNVPESTSNRLYQYRTKFVQYMLASPLYANSAVGKPWEMIGSVSNQIIDDILVHCARDMQLENVLQQLYRCETN